MQKEQSVQSMHSPQVYKQQLLVKPAVGLCYAPCKVLMADFADAFVALPGGYGTADELFEILTWAQWYPRQAHRLAER